MSRRVLHVDPERDWGGGEVQVLALLGELDRRGHRSLLAAPPDGPLARAAAAAGVPVVACPIANHVDLRVVPRLRRLAREHDVVHFHTARAHALAPWLRGLGARLVVTRRMDYVPRRGAYTRYLYNRAVDVVIAISEGVRAALVAAGVHATRIHVVPSGVDAEALVARPQDRATVRAEWGVAGDDVLVAVIGVLEPRKGHGVLLEAAARLERGEIRLHYVFCGSGSQDDSLRAAAARFGVPVRFAGFRGDVGACLAAADLVVVPSLAEGLGVAALEAMAAGRPLVASRVGGLAEAVVDGETGILVPPGDPVALAGAVGALAADPARRVTMGRRGAARVRAHYSVAAMAEGTLACYGEAP